MVILTAHSTAGGGVDNGGESLILTLQLGHGGHHGLEVVTEGHGEATDDQAGVVQKQPPSLSDNLRERPETKSGHGVTDSNHGNQVASLGISQAELLSVVLNIIIGSMFHSWKLINNLLGRKSTVWGSQGW